MPKLSDTISERAEKFRTTAMELGVYLPAGVYSKARDEVADLNRRRMEKLFDDLVKAGQDQLEPIERRIRRRAEKVEKKSKAAATSGAARVAIPNYDDVTAEEIVDRLDKLPEAELKAIRRYEKANKNRKTIIEKIDTLTA